MSLALDPERTGPEDCACKVVTHAQITTLPQKSLSGVRNFLSVLVASRVAESRMDQTVPFISRSSVARIAHPLELHHYRHVVERMINAFHASPDALNTVWQLRYFASNIVAARIAVTATRVSKVRMVGSIRNEG